MGTSPQDLTTVANVKTWLSIVSATEDDLFQRLVTAISNEVLTFLGRPALAAASYTEVRDGTGTSTLAARNYPLISVASLFIDTIAIKPSSDGLQPGFVFDSFVLKLIGMPPTLMSGGVSVQLYSAPCIFRQGKNNVTFTYSAGLSAEILPDLEQEVIEIIAKKYLSRKRIGLKSTTSKAGESSTFDTEHWQENPPPTIRRLQFKGIL